MTSQQTKKVSIGIGIGVPVFFAIVSLFTGNWRFLTFSLAPAFIAMMSGIAAAKAVEKKQTDTRDL